MLVIDQYCIILDVMGHGFCDPDLQRKVYTQVEGIARTCYRSHDKITKESAEELIGKLIRRGHHAMLEFVQMTVSFRTDRGASHELVRHRLCSFAQESTRYCDYNRKGVEFIRPVWLTPGVLGEWNAEALETIQGQVGALSDEEFSWISAMISAEQFYQLLSRQNWPPEKARTVLPNSLATTINVSANLREWRHIFALRALGTTGKPHPQMQALMLPVFMMVKMALPAFFIDMQAPEVPLAANTSPVN